MKFSKYKSDNVFMDEVTFEYLVDKITDKIISGNVDLKDYYTKEQVNDMFSEIHVVDGIDGTDGVGIANVQLVDYELIISLSDGTKINLGNVRGMQGIKGADGTNGKDGIDGIDGKDGRDGADGLNGKDGLDGKSAYDIAKENGFDGNEFDWLLSLKGEKGEKGDAGEKGKDGAKGKDGLSAYQIAVNNGFVGDETEWLISLKGEKGADGKTGAQGDKGDQGIKGDDGFAPVITPNVENTTDIYKLDIKTATGTMTTPNLKGEDSGYKITCENGKYYLEVENI